MQRHNVTLILPCRSDLEFENLVRAIISETVRCRKLIVGRDIG